MPELKSAVQPHLILIKGGFTPPFQPATDAKLIRVERYLARQLKAAHNLGVRPLEHYYNVAFLALRLWHIETLLQDRGAL